MFILSTWWNYKTVKIHKLEGVMEKRFTKVVLKFKINTTPSGNPIHISKGRIRKIKKKIIRWERKLKGRDLTEWWSMIYLVRSLGYVKFHTFIKSIPRLEIYEGRRNGIEIDENKSLDRLTFSSKILALDPSKWILKFDLQILKSDFGNKNQR